MIKSKLQIENMACSHCVKTVRKTLTDLPGVAACDVSVGTATVEYNPHQVGEERMVRVLEEIGFPAKAQRLERT